MDASTDHNAARRPRAMGVRRRVIGTMLGVVALLTLALVVESSASAVTITGFAGTIGRASDLPYCYGSTLTISGTGFVNDGGVLGVTIGGVPAQNIIVGSDSTLYALIGPGATTGTVSVTTKAGTATSTTQELIYPCASGSPSSLPTVSSAPAKARDGSKIQLLGSGFIGITSVTVAGMTTRYAIPSDQNMYVIIPSTAGNGKNGKATIALTNAKGTVNVSIVLTSAKS